MKRLIFCFDGTWNTLEASCPTNVVLTAESVLPLTPEGIAQVVFYSDGVGTAKFEKLSGGMFGAGLVDNMADAYRFLIFNYTPGDEIYVFGFSRGAYTARSFVGLLHTSGILLRKCAHKVKDAIDLYRRRDSTAGFGDEALCFRRDNSPDICVLTDENDWRLKNGLETQAPLLEIKYLGVWDTVGALGIPQSFVFAHQLTEKQYQFHDTALSSFVLSARHAVAIDERRRDFAPTLWTNTDELNKAKGVDPTSGDAPYQQKWFPGVHSSVGGGGERRGLSDQALDWVLDGARAAGLVLDSQGTSRVFGLQPDYTEFVECSTDSTLLYNLMNGVAAADRTPGPSALHEVSISAKRRWLDDAKHLKDKVAYRPKTLDGVKEQLNALDPAVYGLGQEAKPDAEFDMYQVQPRDSLRKIAKELLGSADRSDEIFHANLNKIDDPNRIYVGQMLRIPKQQVAR